MRKGWTFSFPGCDPDGTYWKGCLRASENYLPNVLVSAVALCTTKCVLGLIAGAATLDVTRDLGVITADQVNQYMNSTIGMQPAMDMSSLNATI